MRVPVLKARARIIDLVNDRAGYRLVEPDKLNSIEHAIVNAAADLIVAAIEEVAAAPVPDGVRDRVIAEVRSAIVAGRTTPGVTLAVAERCADVLLALLAQPAAQYKCRLCEDTRWVCEQHPDRPWSGMNLTPNACPDGCIGPGEPCPLCHPQAQPAAQQAALRAALESIAANTCCEGCGEAARVARAASPLRRSHEHLRLLPDLRALP